jgi:hypothetical protein
MDSRGIANHRREKTSVLVPAQLGYSQTENMNERKRYSKQLPFFRLLKYGNYNIYKFAGNAKS